MRNPSSKTPNQHTHRHSRNPSFKTPNTRTYTCGILVLKLQTRLTYTCGILALKLQTHLIYTCVILAVKLQTNKNAPALAGSQLKTPNQHTRLHMKNPSFKTPIHDTRLHLRNSCFKLQSKTRAYTCAVLALKPQINKMDCFPAVRLSKVNSYKSG